MILTAALILMIVAMLGLIALYRQLLHEIRFSRSVGKYQASALKTMIASLRHDLSLDLQGMDERFEGLSGQIRDEAFTTRRVMADQHKRTRKDIQEVKTGDEWSKNRENEILERLDELIQRTVVTNYSPPILSLAPSQQAQQVETDTIVLKEGETHTIAGTKIHTVKGDTSVGGDIKDKRKPRRTKKKPSSAN